MQDFFDVCKLSERGAGGKLGKVCECERYTQRKKMA